MRFHIYHFRAFGLRLRCAFMQPWVCRKLLTCLSSLLSQVTDEPREVSNRNYLPDLTFERSKCYYNRWKDGPTIPATYDHVHKNVHYLKRQPNIKMDDVENWLQEGPIIGKAGMTCLGKILMSSFKESICKARTCAVNAFALGCWYAPSAISPQLVLRPKLGFPCSS